MITVREFLEDINNEVRENPLLLDMPILFASDDEGNSYSFVENNVCKIQYEKYGNDIDVEFKDDDNYELNEEGENVLREFEFNALLIN